MLNLSLCLCHFNNSICRHQQKSSDALSAVAKPTTSPSNSSKVVTTPKRPPSPGNVRPVKKESKKKTEDKQPDIMEDSETKELLPAVVETTKEDRPQSPSPVGSETVQGTEISIQCHVLTI